MMEWREKDPAENICPPELTGDESIDVRWDVGDEFKGVITSEVNLWEGVTHWRPSEISAEEARGRITPFLEALMAVVKSRAARAEPQPDHRKRILDKIRGKIQNQRGNPLSDLMDQIRDMLMERTGHTGGPNCPACAAQDERNTRLTPEDQRELESLRSLIDDTPELARWTRLIAGNVLNSLVANGYDLPRNAAEARQRAMAFMTGDMDIDPTIEGVRTAIAILLRDDVDFATFRRNKLLGRAPGVNDKLNAVEKDARRRYAVLKIPVPGEDDKTIH